MSDIFFLILSIEMIECLEISCFNKLI